MAFIGGSFPQKAGDVSVTNNGDLTDIYTAGIIKEKRDERSTDTNIPAGASIVDVYNTGMVNIIVNGEEVRPGGRFHREKQEDRVNKVIDFCTSVNVSANGGQYEFSVIYPSSSTVNISAI